MAIRGHQRQSIRGYRTSFFPRSSCCCAWSTEATSFASSLLLSLSEISFASGSELSSPLSSSMSDVVSSAAK